MKTKRIFFASATLFSVLFFAAENATAYESGIHFYLTYILANQCGLGIPGEAAALADYSVDRFHNTDAGSHFDEWLDPMKEKTRRIFHFPVNKDKSMIHKVVRGSSYAWETIAIAINEATPENLNPVTLGIGLHTLQDSYAHEGFTPLLGHWTIEPDLPKSDVPKLLEAAQSTWTAMDAWSMKVYGHGCVIPFSDLEERIQAWGSLDLDSDSELHSAWNGIAEALTGNTINLGTSFLAKDFQQEFEKAVEHIRSLKD